MPSDAEKLLGKLRKLKENRECVNCGEQSRLGFGAVCVNTNKSKSKTLTKGERRTMVLHRALVGLWVLTQGALGACLSGNVLGEAPDVHHAGRI